MTAFLMSFAADAVVRTCSTGPQLESMLLFAEKFLFLAELSMGQQNKALGHKINNIITIDCQRSPPGESFVRKMRCLLLLRGDGGSRLWC